MSPRFLRILLAPALASGFLAPVTGFGLITLGNLTKEEAKEMGITMKARQNGDAGIKVWLEFKEKGDLESFTYAELRMTDEEGNHLVSAMLRPHPVVHGQAKDLTSVSFSAQVSQLEHCSFWVVTYGSTKGDVGYILRVKDFIGLEELAGKKAG